MNFKPLLIAAIGVCIGVAALETYYRYGAGGSVATRGEIQQIIRDYIVAHPGSAAGIDGGIRKAPDRRRRRKGP